MMQKLLKILIKIFPGLRYLKNYSISDFFSDFIAGITVGLTVLPQSLAYATLAGLEPQYGLYSAFVGGIVYALFGTCRVVTIGPTALLALMTSRHTSLGLHSGPTYAILLCLLSGIVELAMGFLKLGALVDLISLPVTVGFTSATAVIIATSQVKGLLGIRAIGKSSSYIDTVKTIFSNIQDARLGDTSLGIISLIILLLMRRLKDFKLNDRHRGAKYWDNFFWITSTARNALIVLIASLIAFFKCNDNENDNCPFILTSTVKSGLPTPRIPDFHTRIVGPNGTEIEQNFYTMLNELGSSIIIVPIIAVLGNVAISKAFKSTGVQPTRELIALSLSNIFGSFFSSIPITGSFSRSAVNHASNVRTVFGGLYTSALVLIALKFLASYFKFIPKAALSAVIISAVIFMIEYEVIKPLWWCSRRELLPGAVTFVFSLTLGVELGLLLGVSSDLAFLVYRAARPALSVNKCDIDGLCYILIKPKHSLLYFPAIEWVRNGVSKAVDKYGIYPVVLDCTNLNEFDFTAARGMGALQKELQIMEVQLFLLKPSEEIKSILSGATQNNYHILESINDLRHLIADSSEVIIPLFPVGDGNDSADHSKSH